MSEQKVIISGSLFSDGEYLLDAAVQDLAYDATVSGRIQAKAASRKARQTRARLQAVVAGGFVYHPAVQSRPSAPASTRGERRRAKLGRS